MNQKEMLNEICDRCNKKQCPFRNVEDVCDEYTEIRKHLEATEALKKRSVFDLNKNKRVFVNKLIYKENVLLLVGYSDVEYKVSECGFTWIA